METDFEQRLRETVEQVQACPFVREKYDRGPVAIYMERAEDAFKIMRQVQDAPLSVELEENFHRYSNLFFSWRALEPFDKIAGEFHIRHLAETVVRGPQRSAYDPTSVAGRMIEEFRIFETHPVGGTGTYTALRFTRNQDSPEVWYFDIRQGPTKLHISYSDYLDVMLRTRGLYYWQYLFAEPDSYVSSPMTICRICATDWRRVRESRPRVSRPGAAAHRFRRARIVRPRACVGCGAPFTGQAAVPARSAARQPSSSRRPDRLAAPPRIIHSTRGRQQANGH